MTSKKVLRGKIIFQNGIKFLLKLFLRRSTRSKDIFACYWTCHSSLARKNKNNRKISLVQLYLFRRPSWYFHVKKKKKFITATREAWHFQISPIIFNIDQRERERGDNLFCQSGYFCEKKVLQLFFKLEIDFWNVFFDTCA